MNNINLFFFEKIKKKKHRRELDSESISPRVMELCISSFVRLGFFGCTRSGGESYVWMVELVWEAFFSYLEPGPVTGVPLTIW